MRWRARTAVRTLSGDRHAKGEEFEAEAEDLGVLEQIGAVEPVGPGQEDAVAVIDPGADGTYTSATETDGPPPEAEKE